MHPERRAVWAAALIGGLVGAGAILGYSGADVHRMTLSDGLIAQYVAAHLNTPPDEVHPVVTSRGTSLRYGRIGLPWAIWIGSAGRAGAMPYAQPAIMILCAAAIAGAARAMFPRAPPLIAILPFCAIGVLLAVVGGFAEAVAVAMGLWAVVTAGRERWWACAGLLAGAMLARENAGAILVGLIVGYRLWRRPRVLAIVSTSVVPVAIWYVYVRARYGYIPILDPYLRVTTTTIETPFVAIWHSLTKTSGDSLVVAAVTLVLAVGALLVWRRSVLAAVAAASALQVFSAGPFSFKFIGEAARTSMFLQLFLLLTLLETRWSDSPDAGSERENGELAPAGP